MRLSLPSSFAIAAILIPGAPAFASEPQPFVASRDSGSHERALQCLTEAVYYEARSESDDGQRAVAQVVLNRVRHPSYPNSVCGVVYQGSERSTGCQFTFTCDGSITGYVDPASWERAGRIAAAALAGSVYRPVGLALNYHTTAIRPYWAPSLNRRAVVGAHIFYTRPGNGGSADAFSQSPAGDEPDAAMVRYAAPRSSGLRGVRATRVAYEMPVMEIPLVERPVRVRTLGGRSATPAATRASSSAVSVERPPRVQMQRGVRVYRGS